MTWLNHLRARGQFTALGRYLFPIGRRYAGSRSAPEESGPVDYIRHHGDYLRPTLLLNNPALLSVLLRNVALSLLVYFGLSVGAVPGIVAHDALGLRT